MVKLAGSRVGQILRNLVLNVDAYGSTFRHDPRLREKTFLGSIITIIFRLVFLGLVIWSLVRVFSTAPIVSTGETVKFNYKYPIQSEEQMVDFPAMYIEAVFRHQFYEANAPTIQKIEVIDRTGYGPHLTSSVEDVRDVTAVYKSQSVGINSYDSGSSRVLPKSSRSIDAGSTLQQQLTHKFSETLMSIYATADAFSEPGFKSHEAIAYLRFNENQLALLKSCQLQLVLVNAGEYNAIKASSNGFTSESFKNFSTFISPTYTWDPKEFLTDGTYRYTTNDAYNLVILRANYTTQNLNTFKTKNTVPSSIKDSDFMKWRVMINYANNFRQIATNYVCTDKEIHSVSTGAATPVDSTATTLTITRAPGWCNTRSQTPGSFQVLLMNINGVEKVQVTNIAPGCTSFTIVRSAHPVDFTTAKTGTVPRAGTPPPANWTCNPGWYGLKDGCQCNCGAPDPDCVASSWRSDFCPTGQICRENGVCVYAEASNDGEISISEDCTEFLAAGTPYVTGFFGDQSTLGSCKICPGDSLDVPIPTKDSSNTLVCSAATTGYLNSLQADPQLVSNPDQKNSYLQFNILLNNDPFPPVSNKTYSVTADSTSFNIRQVFNAVGKKQLVRAATPQISESAASLFASGSLASSMRPDATEVLVKVDTYTYYSYPKSANETVLLTFPSTGGTLVSSEGVPYTFVSASFVYLRGETYQFLTLGSTRPNAVAGTRLRLYNEVDPGTKSVIAYWEQGFVGNILPVGATMFVYSDSSDTNIEKAVVQSIQRITPWNCELSTYFRGDGICDCNCGSYDPDCFLPGYRIRGCPPGQNFCTYPAATCSAAPTVSPQIFSPLPLLVNITFDVLLLKSHSKHSKLEVGPQNVKIGLLSPIRLSRDDVAYLPINRYKATSSESFESPSSLDVEAAVFVVPEKQTFEQVNLCPNIGITNLYTPSPPFHTWVKQDALTITCSKITNPAKETCVSIKEVDSFSATNYTTQCIKEMPPSKYFDFSAKLPINFKWKPSSFSISDQAIAEMLSDVNSPEVTIDFEVVYTFSHDQDVVTVENLFAQNIKLGGDTTVFKEARSFYGAVDYVGKGSGNVNSTNGLPEIVAKTPATAPYLTPELFLAADANTTIAALTSNSKIRYWKRSGLEALINSFGKLAIPWDFSAFGSSFTSNGAQVISLHPGYVYNMRAQLQVTPQYSDNSPASYFSSLITTLDDYYLGGWYTSVVSSSVSRDALSYLNKNEMRFRFSISIVDKTTQIISKRLYTIKTFIDDVGSAIGIMAIGLTILSLLQKVPWFAPNYASFLTSATARGTPFGSSASDDNQELQKIPATTLESSKTSQDSGEVSQQV